MSGKCAVQQISRDAGFARMANLQATLGFRLLL
jgi:hypothetical protein